MRCNKCSKKYNDLANLVLIQCLKNEIKVTKLNFVTNS